LSGAFPAKLHEGQRVEIGIVGSNRFELSWHTAIRIAPTALVKELWC
jgi:hypothetical protein